MWNQLLDFQKRKQKIASISVVIDHTERGVSLTKEFSDHMTKDEEEQPQFIL